MAEKKPWEDEKLEAFRMLCDCYKAAFCGGNSAFQEEFLKRTKDAPRTR